MVTLGQHLDVFLHSYVPVHPSSVGLEDSLDGLLVGLRLLYYVADRRIAGTGRLEPVYAFRREPKPEITQALFEYCLDDYWRRHHASESSLSVRDVATSSESIGQVFKLPQDDVLARLEAYITPRKDGPFYYMPSAIQGRVTRHSEAPVDLLKAVYARGGADD